ncbi:MAG: thiol:disulfide interchange protein DsbA/DsbL [Betaproteobacteria bacterium]|nr:thiol:disulfide interchange protein DsbA/DsbL [Betaproteobacteria bacterium]
MARRTFTCQSMAALAALQMPAAWAQFQKPVAGTDYAVLETIAPMEAPAGKIEVVEFFWYNCMHCNAFEPILSEWAKKLPKDVAFRRVPVAFNASFAPQQRLYYALEAMGLLEKVHPKVFAAIHVDKLNLSKGEAITEWIGKNGVDTAKFLVQYNSFGVVTKAQKASQLQNAFKVEGVPALGVAGRFYTDGTMARSMERALLVVQSLLDDIRKQRA